MLDEQTKPETPQEAQNSDLSGNTEQVGYKKPPVSKQFKKKDPRINRAGRPKTFGELRNLAQVIAQEKHPGAVKAGQGWTRIEAILRDWAGSGNHQKQRAFVETAYGKVPDELKLDLGRMTDAELRAWLAPILARFGLDIGEAGTADSQGDSKRVD